VNSLRADSDFGECVTEVMAYETQILSVNRTRNRLSGYHIKDELKGSELEGELIAEQAFCEFCLYIR